MELAATDATSSKKAKPKRVLRRARRLISWFLSYARLHFIILTSIAVVGAAVIALLERNTEHPVRYIDALFICVSAVTCTGLITSDLSTWRTPTLVALLVILEAGSWCLSTLIAVPWLRAARAKRIAARRRKNYHLEGTVNDGGEDRSIASKEAIESKKHERAKEKVGSEGRRASYATPVNAVALGSSRDRQGEGTKGLPKEDDPLFANSKSHGTPPELEFRTMLTPRSTPSISPQLSLEPITALPRTASPPSSSSSSSSSLAPSPQSSFYGSISGNGAPKPAMTKSMRSEPTFMGLGYDYDMEASAGKWLGWITMAYSIVIQISGGFALVAYATWNTRLSKLMAEHGSNKWAWSFFMSASSFNNHGFMYWKDGLTHMSDDGGFFLIVCFLIMAGSTCSPIFIRLCIYATRNLTQRNLKKYQQSLRYLLVNPTRLTTNLFSAGLTRVLICVYIVLWTIVAVAYVGYTGKWLSGASWITGYFIAIAARTAGLSLVDMSKLPHQFLLLIIMSMYISAYPIAMLRKYTEVTTKNRSIKRRRKRDLIRKFWKSVTFMDTTWLYAAIVFLCYLELRPGRPLEMSSFGILFEVISAYGTVGYSFGYPGMDTSLAGGMCAFSKFTLMTVMLMGRHRGMPKHVYHNDMRRGVTQETHLGDIGV